MLYGRVFDELYRKAITVDKNREKGLNIIMK